MTLKGINKTNSQGEFFAESQIVFNELTSDQTLQVADFFARVLKPGDILLLFGDIGVGKSFFARGLIQSMMINQGLSVEEVPSPTFTIVQTYDLLSPPVWHLDLYRFVDSEEIHELGLTEVFNSIICCIEWPNKMGTFIPKRNISMKFDLIETCESRKVFIEFNGNGWEYVCEGLKKNLLL